MTRLSLPFRAPKCFDSQEQWNEYCSAAMGARQTGFNFCVDCTPRRQASMDANGRCAHPEVRFVRVNGELVGKR